MTSSWFRPLLVVLIFSRNAHGSPFELLGGGLKIDENRLKMVDAPPRQANGMVHHHIHSSFPTATSIPRGGSINVDAGRSLQIFTMIYLLQGPVCIFAPRLNARVYGIQTSQLSPEQDAQVAFLMRGCGTLILGLGVVSSLLAQDFNPPMAVAISNIFVVLNCLISAIVGVPGVPTTSLIVGLSVATCASVLPLLATYKLVPQTSAQRFLQLYIVFGSLNGAVGALAPDILSRPWNFEISGSHPAARTLMRTYGTWCLGYCVCSLLLLRQSSVVKAVGWGSLPAFLLLLAGNLVTKEFEQLGMNKGLILFWFLFNILVLTPLLIT